MTCYISRFVDREKLMRYLGGGVGHRAIRFASGSESLVTRDEEQEDEGQQDEVQPPLEVPEDVPVVPEELEDGEGEHEDAELEENIGDEAEGDYGYAEEEADDGNEDEDIEVDEADFGPEDGDDDVGDEELEDAEGFAPL